MTSTSRELVYQTLNFKNPARAPRQMWALPWADIHHPGQVKRILDEFPPDIESLSNSSCEKLLTKGDPNAVGEYTDAWGATFVNIQAGVMGEVRDPLVKDWDADAPRIHVPNELLTFDADEVNRRCDATGKFMIGGSPCRPFEQLQFLRGTAELYIDLLEPCDAMLRFVREMHQFYCQNLETWGKTNVDGVLLMDDWGAQHSLLISPKCWREIFKPMYREYVEIARAAGKKVFMHSDGYILDIYPDLVEIGIDALNSQLFCMGIDNLVPFAGKITFWGEIDRQNLLPNGTTEEIDAAVKKVRRALWHNGGCIAQCEFGPGANPANVYQTFHSWNQPM